MTEAEQGIKITEVGITMKQYLPIIISVAVGWIFGMASSLFFYWFERFRNRRDLKNGLKSELIENIPRMVMSVSSLKLKLGTLDHKHLNWARNTLLKYYSQEKIDELSPMMNKLLSQTPDELKKASYDHKILRAGKGTELRKFNLVFLENHLDRILLLDIDSQKRIYNIQFRIDVVNQAVDRYFFYFDKTFEPEILKVNEEPLKENIDAAYKMISKSLFIATNDVITLLEKL